MRTIAAAAAVTAIAVSIRAQQRRQDDLSGEVAVVTGASRGLGLLLATELAGQGCRLVICARSETNWTGPRPACGRTARTWWPSPAT